MWRWRIQHDLAKKKKKGLEHAGILLNTTAGEQKYSF